MAKDKLTDYDSTAANNLDVGGISVAEGMLPSAVNNAIRELMSHQAEAFGAGTPLYVDQTNNRLGIGNAAPTVPLDVTGAAVVSGDLTVDTSTLKVDSTNNRVGIVNASPTTALDVTGDITVSGGVYVGGTGSANYLDDYEEGTWTPTDGSGAGLTFTVSFAKYTKIGNLCHLQAYFTYPSTADINNTKINGLPFATQAQGFAAFYVNSAIEVMAQIQQNASSLQFKNLSNTNYTNAQLGGGFVVFSGTYITA